MTLMLQWLGGAGFQDLLAKMEALGFFRYILPFLLIFAVVYAILNKVETFKDNKGASTLIAIAIGLLALQLQVVPAFFQTIFPKLGVGLAILMTALILAGAFISDSKEDRFKWIFFGLGMAIFLFVVLSSLSDWQFVGSQWWHQYGSLLITLGVVIAAIVLVIKFGGNSSSS